MEKEISLANRLCLHFCPYYKPTKREELACLGFLVVERLIKEGKEVAFKTSKNLNHTIEEALVHNMCTSCSFYGGDCDFIQNSDSPPCGGFTLLRHLLEVNVITIADIIRNIK